MIIIGTFYYCHAANEFSIDIQRWSNLSIFTYIHYYIYDHAQHTGLANLATNVFAVYGYYICMCSFLCIRLYQNELGFW